MPLFSKKTFLEVLTSVFTNVTAGWFTVVLISPGIFGVSFPSEYFALLTKNVPFGIVGLVLTSMLAEKVKSLP